MLLKSLNIPLILFEVQFPVSEIAINKASRILPLHHTEYDPLDTKVIIRTMTMDKDNENGLKS